MGTYKGDETTGFQSPAQDYVEEVLDLAQLLDLRRPGRYPVRVKGQGFRARGIREGDILVTDAAALPQHGKVCVAMAAGEVLLGVLTRSEGGWSIARASGALITVTDDVEVWAIAEALVRTKL